MFFALRVYSRNLGPRYPYYAEVLPGMIDRLPHPGGNRPEGSGRNGRAPASGHGGR